MNESINQSMNQSMNQLHECLTPKTYHSSRWLGSTRRRYSSTDQRPKQLPSCWSSKG